MVFGLGFMSGQCNNRANYYRNDMKGLDAKYGTMQYNIKATKERSLDSEVGANIGEAVAHQYEKTYFPFKSTQLTN